MSRRTKEPDHNRELDRNQEEPNWIRTGYVGKGSKEVRGSTFTGLGDGDNVRVSTMAGRSSKNPNNAYPSSTINPRGFLAAEAREP
ncbi:hypothetical protein Tco_0285967 [Tanacetum coccineum]